MRLKEPFKEHLPRTFKTKKIFVGGIASSIMDGSLCDIVILIQNSCQHKSINLYRFIIFFSNCSDEFKNFFSKYGKVLEHKLIMDYSTNRSHGFGFIVFDSEQVVDDLLAKGNMIDLTDSHVSVLWCIIAAIVSTWIFAVSKSKTTQMSSRVGKMHPSELFFDF